MLVTGATGFIGAYLVTALIAEGARVTIITRDDSKVFESWRRDVKILECDISLSEVSLPKDIEYLFHCAGSIGNPEEYKSANITATLNILSACKELQYFKRLIYLSSIGVMGSNISGNVDETLKCNPQNLYEKSKFKAERLVLGLLDELPVAILRPSSVIGVYSDRKRDPFLKLLKAIKHKRFMLIGKRRTYINLICVEDVVGALITIGKANGDLVSGNCYILNDPIPWVEFSSIISNALEVKEAKILPRFIAWPLAVLGSTLSVLKIKFPITLVRYKGLTNKTIFESAKIRKELGYSPTVGVEAGIIKMTECYKDLL